MAHGTFGTAINCMDGRTQMPVAEWIKSKFGVDYVDTITEPGPDKMLAAGAPGWAIESIKTRVLISVNKHNSGVIVIVGHDDCAGNPVTKEEHFDHVRKSMKTLASWGLPVKIFGVWVDGNWQVELIDSIE